MVAKGRSKGIGRSALERGESGQSSVEWVGLLLLLAVVFTFLGGGLGRVDVAGFIHPVSRALLCAVSLTGACPEEGPVGVYEPEVESLVRRLSPEIRFGSDLLGMPVDFRLCRSPACAGPPADPELAQSAAGEPLTLFTRVVDCRDGRAGENECGGPAAGNLYIQYWAYFPESATFRRIPLLARRGYHRHDWESVQFRIEPDGTVSQRASSHAGYNHGRSIGNWPSDAGVEMPAGIGRMLGRQGPGGWGPWTGRWLIEGGSHAGNVADPGRTGNYPVRAPGGRALLVPLEGIRGDALGRPARFDPISPPWSKRVWSDPEAEGTG